MLRDHGIEAGSRKFKGEPAIFNKRVSEAFIQFMVAIFGKYRDFIQKDFEFDVEGFAAAVERTETTRIFLGTIRDLQLFEAWARERAALVQRAAAASPNASPDANGGRTTEKFTLALYDKFEALVEVEGEFVGMNWAEKAYAKYEKEQREAREKEARMMAKKQRIQAGQRRSSLEGAPLFRTKSEKSPSPPRPADVCSEAVFEHDGPLGISWVQQKTDNAAVVKGVRPGSAAATIGGLRAGLVLTSVNGIAVEGLAYSEVIDSIRESERPLTLCFDPAHIQNQIVAKAKARFDVSPEPKGMVRLQSDPGIRNLVSVALRLPHPISCLTGNAAAFAPHTRRAVILCIRLTKSCAHLFRVCNGMDVARIVMLRNRCQTCFLLSQTMLQRTRKTHRVAAQSVARHTSAKGCPQPLESGSSAVVDLTSHLHRRRGCKTERTLM